MTGDYLGLAYQPSGLKRSYNICTVHSKCNWLRLHLRLEFDSIENPPAFAEKVDWFKWWKDGDTMARIRTESELTEAKRLIKLAYKQVEQWANPVSRTEHEPTVTTKVTGNPLPTSAYKLPILAVLIKNDGYLHRNDFLSTIEINMLDSMTDADYGKTKNGRREIWKDHAASMAHRMKKKGLIVCKGGKNWEITAKGRKYYEKYKDTGISGDNLNLKNNLIRKRKTPSQTNDPIDTIIVPAREDGFQETFLGKNCWYQIRLSKSKIPVLKYIAVYRKAPISAITHIAEIDRIEEYQNSGKYIVYFKGKAKEIEHINRQEGGFAPQCPVFTSRERLRKAKSVSDVI